MISLAEILLAQQFNVDVFLTDINTGYMLGPDVELIRFVFALDKNSKLIRKKEYSYNRSQKKAILESCARNNSNLLVDTMNAHYYTEIATADCIHCRINGMQY